MTEGGGLPGIMADLKSQSGRSIRVTWSAEGFNDDSTLLCPNFYADKYY